MGFKFYIVYKTINLINNRYYIGVHFSNKLKDNYLGSGLVIKNAIDKYGRENFERQNLYVFNSAAKALSKEAEIVSEETIKKEFCYNLIPGGGKPPIHKGDNHHFYGQSRTNQDLEKISKGIKKAYKEGRIRKDDKHHHFYGTSLSVKHKEKISKAMRGEKNHFYGKKHKNDSKKYMGGAHPDVDFSRGNNPSARKIRHIPTGEIFDSCKDAAEWQGIPYKTFMDRIYTQSSLNKFEYI